MDSNTHTQQLVLQTIDSNALVVQKRKDIYFKKGDDPLLLGDTSKYFYFVMSGKIKIYDIDFDTSKEQILYMFSYGDMFDVVALLDGKPNQYLAEVLEDAHVIQFPLEDIKELILRDEKFRQYFYSYIASQIKSMEDLAISLSFYDVYHRVLQLFVRFTEQVNGSSRLKVIDNLSHEDIASMVGSVRKVVNRALQKLKQDGIIEVSRKNIHIKNFQKLLEQLK
ncbi:transcriptional regulator, Crp/Fnr family [hydrothermal vent metagenome]|uniref:Transcriptional regulator, Crp/Fnr family n=1 Tax=hydrothermal vent metagenome TaxID=652676 RepID=A0A1W1D1X9_9ZZZZ